MTVKLPVFAGVLTTGEEGEAGVENWVHAEAHPKARPSISTKA